LSHRDVFIEQTLNVIANSAKRSRATKRDWIDSWQQLLAMTE
jgi:hypothetical protein